MQIINKEQVQQFLDYPGLTEMLRQAFQANYKAPPRPHYTIANPHASKSSKLLLMPAWEEGSFLGVKTIIVAPENNKHDLPAVQGTYILYDANKGFPLLSIDAPALTTRRTAATSALASSYLSRPDSKSLLMVGTGALAPQLIAAHTAVRPIKQVFIWGRNFAKADALARRLSTPQLKVNATPSIPEVIHRVDIISCATLSQTPLIEGKWLLPGQHLDLVGAYLPHTREADDEAIQKASLFVDNRETAPAEVGELLIPLQNKVIQATDILADLFELCLEKHTGRQQADEITLFKSVGLALEDLAAARMIYEKLKE